MTSDNSPSRHAAFRFCKMQGAGNDFILLDGARYSRIDDPGVLARKLCRRRLSVGADGLIIVSPGAGHEDIQVRFWNPDGGEIDTCGNGTRCAARYAVLTGAAEAELRIATRAGAIDARVERDSVTLRYNTEPSLELDVQVATEDAAQRGHRVDVGNPHFVVPVDELPDAEIEPTCRPLRFASAFAPAGVNVHLVQFMDRHRIRIRSYERGVEAETLACGSGAMASAIALCAAGKIEPPVHVETRSGVVLRVGFKRDPAGSFRGLELAGPAEVVYWGELPGA